MDEREEQQRERRFCRLVVFLVVFKERARELSSSAVREWAEQNCQDERQTCV
jgi:hypothetical protein